MKSLKSHFPKIQRCFLGFTALLFFVLSISGCAVQLAPTFNKDIVTGITVANKDALEFLSSVDAGTTQSTFANRKDKYDKLIGSFESISTQIKARPIPSNKVKDKVNELLSKRGVPALADADYPSLMALEEVVKNLKKMKDKDGSSDMGKPVIDVFKSALNISIDQALTYENFLER